MARIRSIKPEFCSSRDTGTLSRDARLFFLQLLTEADDEGRLQWIPRKLCGVLYPHDDDVTRELLVAWAQQCAVQGMVTIYEMGDADFLQVTNWSKHQRISHPTKSRLPAPDSEGVRIISGNTPDLFRSPPEPIRPDLGTGNREQGEGKEEKPSSTDKPSTPPAAAPAELAEVRARRLAEITNDAKAAFNAKLGKPHGLLPAVHAKVGLEKHRDMVKRCIRTASRISEEQYGTPVITRQFWDTYFAECERDEFKSGRQPPGKGHENWTPSFEYLTRELVMIEVFDKVMADQAEAGGKTGAQAA